MGFGLFIQFLKGHDDCNNGIPHSRICRLSARQDEVMDDVGFLDPSMWPAYRVAQASNGVARACSRAQ